MDEEHYRSWHSDHISYQVRKRVDDYVGSEIKYEQSIDAVSFWWEVVGLTQDQIVYKAKFVYPIFLMLSFQNFDDHLLITQEMRLGFTAKGIDKLLDWIVRKLVFTKKVEEKIELHTRQELKNLEHILPDSSL